MTSKEALIELSNKIHRERCINSEHNKKINDLQEIISKDLERLKQLEDLEEKLGCCLEDAVEKLEKFERAAHLIIASRGLALCSSSKGFCYFLKSKESTLPLSQEDYVMLLNLYLGIKYLYEKQEITYTFTSAAKKEGDK